MSPSPKALAQQSTKVFHATVHLSATGDTGCSFTDAEFLKGSGPASFQIDCSLEDWQCSSADQGCTWDLGSAEIKDGDRVLAFVDSSQGAHYMTTSPISNEDLGLARAPSSLLILGVLGVIVLLGGGAIVLLLRH
jgi:hypothetical protein